MDTNALEVTDATFEVDVIEESRRRPVIVDLWAEWCAPCRALGPVLERLAEERAGAFRLAKVDVDRNPVIAQQFQVMSIPAVKAFVGGRMVDEFTGALPEDQVRKWLDPLVPNEADEAAAAAAALETAGDLDAAEAGYRAALNIQPGNAGASLGLARVLVARGDASGAEALVAPLLPDPEAERVMSMIRLTGWGSEPSSGDPLAAAQAKAAAGEWAVALDDLLAIVRDVPGARDAVLDIFAVLGDDHDITRAYRPKLAAALF